MAYNQYRDYLTAKQKRLAENPYETMTNKTAQTLSTYYTDASNKMGQAMYRTELPESARIGAMQESITQLGSQIGDLFQGAGDQNVQRREELLNKIDELSVMATLEDKRLAEEAKQKKNSGNKAITQAISTVVGTGVGFLAGNPVLGAELGSGAGGIISGSGAVTDGEIDPEALMGGLNDTISGVSSMVNLKSQKDMFNKLGGFVNSPAYKALDGAGKQNLSAMLQMAVGSGQWSNVSKILEGFNNGTMTIPVNNDWNSMFNNPSQLQETY